MKTPICDMIESAIRLCEENDCTVEFVKMFGFASAGPRPMTAGA